jgi:hypothetical protein
MSHPTAVNCVRQFIRVTLILAGVASALAALTGSYSAGYADGHRDAADWYMHQDITQSPVPNRSDRR